MVVVLSKLTIGSLMAIRKRCVVATGIDSQLETTIFDERFAEE